MKRYVVTGRSGQVVSALVAAAAGRDDILIVPLGRPELDLADPGRIGEALIDAAPDVIISAAAYTAVDAAEDDADTAFAVNAAAPAVLASVAARLSVPLVHLSTDYVFDGTKDAPYTETDATAPLGVYGRSKLDGERAVAATANHAILRTSWVYGATGKNFLKTMLRLAETRDRIGVVADQIGNPSSADDIARAVLGVAGNLLTSDDPALRGVFHMAGTGAASWAAFAEEIFRQSARQGGPTATVEPIATAAYPTRAKRPANSRLDCTKLAEIHQMRLADWRDASAEIVRRVIRDADAALSHDRQGSPRA